MYLRNMNKKVLYRKAYRTLNQSTPLRIDCGLLCNSRCCSSGSSNRINGMHLYPGEKIMHNDNYFLEISSKPFQDLKIDFATCSGKCMRELRPLACRVFPLVPYIPEGGKLHIIEDPRAKYICPLLTMHESLSISKTFRRNIYKTFCLLIQDEDIKKYIQSLSNTLREYASFTGTKLP